MANTTSTPAGADDNLMARALREAFYAALVALGLFVLFVGLKTDQNILNELILVQRWGLLAVFVAIAAVGRFLAVAYVRPFFARQKVTNAVTGLLPDSVATRFFRTPTVIAAAILAVVLMFAGETIAAAVPAALAPWVTMIRAMSIVYVLAFGFFYFRVYIAAHFNMLALVALIIYPPVIVYFFGFQGSLKYVDNFGIQILIYVMLAWGLNIVVGLAGLLDLGYVAFYAVGAYSYALLSTYFGLSFWVLLPLAGILAAFWGMILGFPVLRLKGDYLAIVTLGLRGNHPPGSDQLDGSDQGHVRHFGHCQGLGLRHLVLRCQRAEQLCQGLRSADVVGLLQDLPVLSDPRTLPADGLCHDPPASHADRSRLGSPA